MPVEMQAHISQLVLCSQHVSEDMELVENDSQDPQTPKKIVTRKTADVLGKIEEPQHQPNAKDVKHHSVQLVGALGDQSAGEELGLSHRWEEPRVTRGPSLAKTLRGPFSAWAIRGQAGRKMNSTTFLLAADPQVRLCERALPHRSREERKRHQRQRARSM